MKLEKKKDGEKKAGHLFIYRCIGSFQHCGAIGCQINAATFGSQY